MYKRLRVETGFSLIETLVVVSITGIIGLSLIMMVQQGMQGQQTVSENLAYAQLQADIVQTMLDPLACAAPTTAPLNRSVLMGNGKKPESNARTVVSMDAKNPITYASRIVNMRTNSMVAQIGQYVGGVAIESIKIEMQKQQNGQYVIPVVMSSTMRMAPIEISVVASKRRGFGGALSTARIKVNMLINNSNQILGCMSNIAATGPIDTRWVYVSPAPANPDQAAGNAACATLSAYGAYVYAQISDGANNAVHALTEGGSASGDSLFLCVAGPMPMWTSGACPAGSLDTQLLDDSGSTHSLEENSGNTSQRYCLQGAIAAAWRADCLPDEHWYGRITDNENNVHSLTEGGGATEQILKFCVK